MPTVSYSHRNATRLLAFGAAGYLLWRVLQSKEDLDKEYNLQAGKWYEFRIVAHPFGDAAEWETEAREALSDSLARGVRVSAGDTRADVIFTFQKQSPVTTKLPPHTVLYPNTPALATATLLSAKATVAPLGTSTS